jgi:hypothetical protein
MVLKRLVSGVVALFVAVFLYACSSGGSVDILAVEAELLDQIPRFVNDDFDLPEIRGVEIVWRHGDTVIEDSFVYVSPLIETRTDITATVRNGLSTSTLSFPITLVPAESGRNARVLRIETDVPLGSIDRETYVGAALMATTDRNGESDLELVTDRLVMRGRGNSSWFTYPKKSYRLKFDEKTSLFGMTPSRDYVLISEYGDKSLLRNTIAFKLASMMEHLEWTPVTRAVEVYFNGVYEGVYTLTEQVEVHDGKIEIDTDPTYVDTGYLVELDMRFYEQGETTGLEWFMIESVPYQIKDPDYDEPGFTTAHNAFIRNAFLDLEYALWTGGNVGAHADLDNLIDFFIVMELFKNVDVGYSSVFIYKEQGDVIRMGPVWDFDISTGNIDYIPDHGPEGFYGTQEFKNRWFRMLMQDDTMRMAFKARFEEVYDEKIPLLLDILSNLSDDIRPMATRNFARHDIMGQYVWPNPPEIVAIMTHAGHVAQVSGFIRDRADWMIETMQGQSYLSGRLFD